MHIFISGVAGFLGSNLADHYLKIGFKVSGCDNLIGGSLENVDPRVIFYKGDWTDNKFNGYGEMYSNKSDLCMVKTDEPYNINVLNTFYNFFLDK